MATEPRQGFGPTDIISNLSSDFVALIALLEEQIKNLDARPVTDGEALSHLQRALKAARRGVQQLSRLNE